MEKEIFEQGRVFADCLKYNEEILNKLSFEIHTKKFSAIVLAARGSSDNAGNYFKYAYESLVGTPVALAAPSVNTIYNGNLNLKNCLVIGVSQSGAAEDVMAVLDNAKKQKATTITITNNLNSKMAKMADYHLFCNAGEEVSVAATKTFTSEMFLLAEIAAKVSGNKEYIENLQNLPVNIEKIFTLHNKIEELAKKYKNVFSILVLARGLNYAIAQETALKLQETSYINARPYAASDFVHGPIAIVDDKTNIILLAPSGSTEKDMVNLKTRLLFAGAKIIMYTDKKEIAEGCADSIILPVSGNDYITPFYNVVISQMLACCLSVERGLNPDAPRGLKKVTITK